MLSSAIRRWIGRLSGTNSHPRFCLFQAEDRVLTASWNRTGRIVANRQGRKAPARLNICVEMLHPSKGGWSSPHPSATTGVGNHVGSQSQVERGDHHQRQHPRPSGEIRGSHVRLGIEAAESVPIFREELYQRNRDNEESQGPLPVRMRVSRRRSGRPEGDGARVVGGGQSLSIGTECNGVDPCAEVGQVQELLPSHAIPEADGSILAGRCQDGSVG